MKTLKQYIKEGEVVQFKRKAKELPPAVKDLAEKWFWNDQDSNSFKYTQDAEYANGVDTTEKIIRGKLSQAGYQIDFDEEYDNIVLTDRIGQHYYISLDEFYMLEDENKPQMISVNDGWDTRYVIPAELKDTFYSMWQDVFAVPYGSVPFYQKLQAFQSKFKPYLA